MPVWNGFLTWIDSLNPTKGSKLEKAINYTQNHRDSLRTYQQGGRCELSNNTTERMVKSYAIGRKASLFHASVAGATME
ncbi:MAG: transposase [Eubacteriales bacterium]